MHWNVVLEAATSGIIEVTSFARFVYRVSRLEVYGGQYVTVRNLEFYISEMKCLFLRPGHAYEPSRVVASSAWDGGNSPRTTKLSRVRDQLFLQVFLVDSELIRIAFM